MKKDDLKNDFFIDLFPQNEIKQDSDFLEKLLTSINESIIHISIEKLFINFLNLNIKGEKEDVSNKFISFALNNLRLNINTDKLPLDEKTKIKDRLIFANNMAIFTLSEFLLNFSDITKCSLQNISIKKIDKGYHLLLKHIDIHAVNELHIDNFFVCPNISFNNGNSSEKNKISAIEVIFELLDKKIDKITVVVSPVKISLSKQKTNEILQCLNLLLFLNQKEHQLFKNNLKNKILKSCYKTFTQRNNFVLERENARKFSEANSERKTSVQVNINEIFLTLSFIHRTQKIEVVD